MFDTGYLKLFDVRGVPVRAHWTVPIGVLLFSGGRFAPGLWLGILALIVLHELGHAFLVHRVGLVNLGIDITGFGGRCRWAGSPTKIQRSVIAWGGVLAQLVVLAVTGLVVLLVGRPTQPFAADLVHAFLRTNLFLMVINLIPFRPLDGAEAWPLFGHLRAEWKRRRKWKERVRPRPKPKKREAKRGKNGGRDAGPQTLREALEEADRNARRP